MSKSLQIKAGENLFDAAIRMYGCLDAVLLIMDKNGIGFTDELSAGQILKGDNVSFDKKSITITPQREIVPIVVMVESGQNMFDLAIQEYGSMEGLISLTLDNNLSFTEDLESSETIKVQPDKLRQEVVEFFKNKNSKPASGLTQTESEQLKPEGIEYWAIEYDFVVS